MNIDKIEAGKDPVSEPRKPPGQEYRDNVLGITQVDTQVELVEGEILPYLTPDALIAYCQSRLSGINVQCREIMTRQDKNRIAQSALGQLHSTLSQCPEVGFNDPNSHAAVDAAYAKAIDAVGANTPLGKQLTQERAKVNDGNNEVKKEQLGSLINTIKNCQSTLNSDAEVDMIRLQSLMSQRQTAIQLATNIVQSLNEQANKIVANIGH